MKISREWLQTYFDAPLPEAQALADALTFHAFEVESIEKHGEDDILDVKVTPNRGHDCLSHRGIAKELSAILAVPLKDDGFRKPVALEPKTDAVRVVVDDAKLCPRFTVAHIRGVRVGPSPEWLQERLRAVGQKPINNIVDATNFVMFDIGQPLHAFDAGKLAEKDGSRALAVRLAKAGEKLTGLDDKEYELASSMLVIEDAHVGAIASIAGIKGGKPTGVDDSTTDLVLEAANWDGISIRKTSAALKLRTDASDRFQQVVSPELAAYGLRQAADLIAEIAGGQIEGFVDVYPHKQEPRAITVSAQHIRAVLGTETSEAEMEETFARLGLPFEKANGEYVVAVPFERLDLEIPEDLAEEVGRIIGYDAVPSVELPPPAARPEVNSRFFAAEKVREELIAKGYSEVYTSVFAEEGERAVLNKVGGEKPYLRTTLVDGLREALERNAHHKDVLGLRHVRMFEIGIVWKGGEEHTMLGIADEEGVREEPLPVSGDTISRYEELPVSTLKRYEPFSRYPAITRDISLWVPQGTEPEVVLAVIREYAGELLVRSELFDTFTKEGKTSLAFRLVFQSFDRTLMDEDANSRMKSVYAGVQERGWEVR